ncbi:hypothetical protein K2173_017319 [Erythroxylum novogranatense]|uniref:DUF7795 domain-containing protein n=1 Tax=Erythroxylum novogranatense TaxID=1862640 RepID=A0AAV8TK67_9ROSI|nr:hypothetical protein K2173_017319 [Erythroxylum novogranatense]
MQGEDCKERAEMKEKIFHILKDFMTRVTMLDKLGTAGSRLLSGFQQGLEFLRRPPINTESELIRNIIKSNETKRIKFYIEASCTNSYDIVQNSSKLPVCLLGLRDHLSRAKTILNDMETFLKDLAGAAQMSGGCLSPVLNCDSTGPLNQQSSDQLMDHPHAGVEESKMMDCATIMGIIYRMLKQDYLMQERIISSVNLKTSSGELESFCMMWSLRPFVNDEILRQAWGLIC